MRKFRQLIWLGCLLAATVTNPVAAQTSDTESNSPPTFGPRVGVRYTTEGPGFEPFTSFEGFVPLQQSPGNNLTFLEGRLLLDNNANLGGNVILGHRLYSQSGNRTYGGYFAYDTRDTGKNVFNQLGVGFESLGENLDFRINGYIPIGDRSQQTSEQTFTSPGFQQNFLLMNTSRVRQFEQQVSGFDTEVGTRLISLGRGSLRGYAGVYYYDAGNEDSFGVKGRLEARPNDLLNLSLQVQNDGIFDTRAFLSLGVNFPGSGPRRGSATRDSPLARLGQSVERQFAIVVDEQTEIENTAVTLFNPTTNQAFQILHVNLGQGAGNGTIENPFGSLQNALNVAKPNQIVYVQSGTNPGIPAFSIPNGVSLLSSGPVQRINTVQSGNILLPLSGSGVRPLVTGTVTLGNSNTLDGFAINGVSGPGIRGMNINNTTIQDNIISNSITTDASNLGNGISLTNATGNINITDNSIRNNAEKAISIDNNAGQVALSIGNNAIADNVNGIKLNLVGTAQGTGQITNNNIANSGTGVDVNLGQNAKLNNLAISDNTIENQAQGLQFRASDNAQSTLNVSNNTIRNLTGDGMNFLGDKNSRTQLTVSGNTINNANGDGIDIDLLDNARATATVSNNQILNSGATGIQADADNDSQLRLVLDSNTVRGSKNQGISIFSGAGGGTAKIFASVRLNALTGNNVSGAAIGDFDAQTFDASTTCLQLRNNTGGNFALVNNGGTLQVENTLPTNTGTVNQTGTTTVARGTCGF